jgi:hypothetical protein
MAIYNELMVGRYNRYLQKLLQMKGPASMNQLAPEMLPVFSLDDVAIENLAIAGVDLYGQSVQQTSGAGNTPFVRLRNPAGSNVLAWVDKLTFASNLAEANAQVDYGAINGASGVAVATVTNNLDGRSTRSTSALILTAANALTQASILTQFAVGINVTYDVVQARHQEIPLLPGNQVQIRGTQVLQTITVSFRWRERFLEEAERT